MEWKQDELWQRSTVFLFIIFRKRKRGIASTSWFSLTVIIFFMYIPGVAAFIRLWLSGGTKPFWEAFQCDKAILLHVAGIWPNLLDGRWAGNIWIEKIFGLDVKVFADLKKHRHRRQSFAGRQGLDISNRTSEISTDSFLWFPGIGNQLTNPFFYESLIHILSANPHDSRPPF